MFSYKSQLFLLFFHNAYKLVLKSSYTERVS